MIDNQESVDPSDEVLQLASRISQSNFNVRHFKKTKTYKPFKVINLSNHAGSISRIYTQSNQQPQLQAQSAIKFAKSTDTLNKTLRYKEPFIVPNKNRAQFYSKSIKRQKEVDKERGKRTFSHERGSNIQKYEREWTKGSVKQKCLQQWLNSILIEFYHDEYFDKSIPKSALKKFGVDQNSLITLGIPAKNITRLYRGLFVFSMGFNELILQLCNGNSETTKVVWKIYSIILQYCSKGGMQTAVGLIQRQSSAKVQVLTNEIAKKQEVIQKNEQLNEQKNNSIFLQIKRLRQENINLNNEKSVLIDQYNVTQQAFSQEVNLRLKFQSKINEIYGMYQELNLKHQKLFKNFNKQIDQLKEQSTKYFQSAQKCQSFKNMLIKCLEENTFFKLQLTNTEKHIEQLVKQRVEYITELSKLDSQIDLNKMLVTEYKVKEQQWVHERNNMLDTIEFRLKSAKETHNQYQLTLEENNRLYVLMSDQRKVMQEYEKQKKNFNNKIISIISENTLLKRKNQELEKKNEGITQKYKDTLKLLQTAKLQNEIKTTSQESYKVFFNQSEANMTQMIKNHLEAEQELVFLRSYHKNMESMMKEKNGKIVDMQKKYKQALEKNGKLTEDLYQSQSKYSLLSEEFASKKESFKLKKQSLQTMHEQMNLKEQQFYQKRQMIELQLQRYRNLSELLARSLKDQKFQRNTQTHSYIQALKTLTSKNDEQKMLHVKISMLEGQIDDQRNRYIILQNNMLKMISEFSIHQEALDDTLQQQRQIIVKTSRNLHPMIFQDLHSRLYRQEEQRKQNTSQIKRLGIELQKQQAIRKEQIQKLLQQSRWEVKKLRIQADRKVEDLNNEIIYMKEKNTQFKMKIKEYQELAQIYKKTVNEKATSQREEVYRYMLQEKKKNIEELYKEVQRMQDLLNTSRNTIDDMANNNEKILMDINEKTSRAYMKARKEVQEQLQLKMKDMQRQIRGEYNKKMQQLKAQHDNKIKNMTIEQIIKIKDISLQSFAEELYQVSLDPKTNSKIKRKVTSVDNRRQFNYKQYWQGQLLRMREDNSKGQQIKRKLRNAYHYYEKE